MKFIHESNRIYAQNTTGDVIAEITFPPCGENTVNIDHTFVSDTLRGQGIAEKLMEATCVYLQADGRKVLLSCSYAQKWFQSHPEKEDLLARPDP
ncbi:MAG: N-acetyltransferase [Zoogloeaceae bacterium]|jgi:predicted GNAT family acetyltransferase|nr:N-acetyltransferase [Zoogloeaceae bacterium]